MDQSVTIAAKIPVLVLDDHPVVLDGIASRLAAEPDMIVVARCMTAADALKALEQNATVVAVVDVKVQSGFSFDFAKTALRRR